MTASPHDAPLSALRSHVDDLATWLAIWEARREPDAHARRCASDAVDAIDAMLRDLYLVRGRLTAEIRRADDDLLCGPRPEPPSPAGVPRDSRAAGSASRGDHPNRDHP